MYLGALREVGVSPVLDERYGYGEEDTAMRALISKFRTLAIDGVLTTNTPEGEAILQRRLSEQQFTIPVLTTENVFEAVALGLMPPSELSTPIDSLLRPPSSEFVKIYEKRFGKKPLMYADTGYDAVMLLAQGVSAVGADTKKLKEYLRGSFTYDGVSGEISFDQNGDVKTADYELQRVGGIPSEGK